MSMRKWFEIRAAAEGETVADVYIFGLIGDFIDDMWGFGPDEGVVTPKTFVEALGKLPESVKTIRVRINSPGGDVFSGLTIANTLRAERAKGRTVETIVEGLAASAASLVAMGGSPLRMADNGMLMVHAPWSIAIGNAKEMRAAADMLDQLLDPLVATYQWHSPLEREAIVALIEGEDGQGTWMDADDALEHGLVDEKVEGLRAAASIDPRAAAKLKVPEKYADRVRAMLRPEAEPEPAPVEPPAPEVVAARPPEEPLPTEPVPAPPAEVLAACAAAGLDIAFAQAVLGDRLTAAQAEARITAEAARRAEAEGRDLEIRALCHLAGQDDLAPGYVAGGMAPEQVRQQLAIITAKLDKVEIDGGLRPDHGSRRGPAIDVVAVYAERNRLKH